MASDDTLHAGDPCPICGGDFAPDPEQDPARLIKGKDLNSPNPDAAARYARRATEKADREGVIHRCDRCGYRARFKTAEAAAAADAADDTARRGRKKARDDRDAKTRDERDGAGRSASDFDAPDSSTGAGASGGATAAGGRGRAGSAA